MTRVQLIADTNVLSYLFKKSPLGIEYRELIGSRCVGITGCTIAELRRGAALARWGERKLQEQRRLLDQFSHVPDTREMAERLICSSTDNWLANGTKPSPSELGANRSSR